MSHTPNSIKTARGHTTIQVLSLLQYLKYRIRHHSVTYMFERTSAGYPRIFSLVYYSESMNEIVLAKIGNYKLRLKHEKGHADGLGHAWIKGDVMHPLGFMRGNRRHVCTYIEMNFVSRCPYQDKLSDDCYDKRTKAWCVFLDCEEV